MKVLIVAGGYLPGFRYGGPVRTLAAMVEQLGDEIDFRIVTSGFDLGSELPYPNITLDTWTRVGNAEVWYAKGRRLSPWFWRKIIIETMPDVIYLNSFMSPASSMILLLRRLHVIPSIPIVLVPRGEFAPSALSIKQYKKRIFITFSGWINLHRDIVWQASSEPEASDIRRAIAGARRVMVAPNLMLTRSSSLDPLPKTAGEARFVWTGRVAPVKNLVGALAYLHEVVNGDIVFDAYGPLEDELYWEECRQAAGRLHGNVRFSYRGELEHAEVAMKLREYHFFLSPTFGENFGHSIAEALSQGLPVLVSDQTPWRNLAKLGIGWDITLDSREEWLQVIAHCVSMDNSEYRKMSARCRQHLERWMTEHGSRDANIRLFRTAAALASGV